MLKFDVVPQPISNGKNMPMHFPVARTASRPVSQQLLDVWGQFPVAILSVNRHRNYPSEGFLNRLSQSRRANDSSSIPNAISRQSTASRQRARACPSGFRSYGSWKQAKAILILSMACLSASALFTAGPLARMPRAGYLSLESPLPAGSILCAPWDLPPSVHLFFGPGARHPLMQRQVSFRCPLSFTRPSPRHIGHCVSDEPFKFTL
jgi:hypothetical protein